MSLVEKAARTNHTKLSRTICFVHSAPDVQLYRLSSRFHIMYVKNSI